MVVAKKQIQTISFQNNEKKHVYISIEKNCKIPHLKIFLKKFTAAKITRE